MIRAIAISMTLWAGAWLISVQAAPRAWTSADGRTIQAEATARTTSEVTLVMNGQTFQVPLSQLSEADQAWARENLPENAAAAAVVPAGNGRSWTVGGESIADGARAIFEVTLNEEERAIALRGRKGWADDALSYLGNGIEIDRAQVMIGLPIGFDPSKATPIWVGWTTDSNKTMDNIRSAGFVYEVLRQHGWIVIGVNALPKEERTWNHSAHVACLDAGLRVLQAAFPGSEKWPMVHGGVSGGASRAQIHLMDRIGVHRNPVIGLLCAANAATINAYDCARYFEVDVRDIRKVSVFVSVGRRDSIADKLESAGSSFRRHVGFENVRAESFDGGHTMYEPHLLEAASWFLEQANK